MRVILFPVLAVGLVACATARAAAPPPSAPQRLQEMRHTLAAVSNDSGALATQSAWLARALQKSGQAAVIRDARLMKIEAIRLNSHAGAAARGLSAIQASGGSNKAVRTYIRLLSGILGQQRLEARFLIMAAGRLLSDPLEVDRRDARYVSWAYAVAVRAALQASRLAWRARALKAHHEWAFRYARK